MDLKVKNLQSSIPVPVSKIQSAAKKIAAALKRKDEVSIVFVGPVRMRSLNKKYLGHDYVTDVITFDLEGSGEIVICPSVAASNAKAYKVSLDRELLLYVVHGFLHLAGYDDHKPADIALIRRKEQQLLDLL